MQISIIGAGGKVARQAVLNLYMQNSVDLDIVLFSKSQKKVTGLIQDINESLCLPNTTLQENQIFPNTLIADDIAEIKNSDLIVVALGNWPSLSDKKKFSEIDNTGRLVQSYINYRDVVDTCENISKYSPNATILMVTNQSDMMSLVARETLDPNKVIGMGGMLDTARFRHQLRKNLMSGTILSNKELGYVCGYHNNDMFYLSQTVDKGIFSEDLLMHTLENTKEAGPKISKLQKNEKYPEINTGPSITPGIAVSSVIRAFTGQAPMITECFNVCLNNDTIAERHGLEKGACVSIPINLSLNKFQICDEFNFSDNEKALAKNGYDNLISLYSSLKTVYLKP